MATKTIRVTVQNIEKVNVAEPKQPEKWAYKCVYVLHDGTVSQSGQLDFPANATAENITDRLRAVAEEFAKRDHWFDELGQLEGTEHEFQFDVGG